MKIFLVSVPLEFPLATYCLAAQLAASPETADCEVEIVNLEVSRLNEYTRKNSEIWRFVALLEAARPDLVAFSVYLWSNLSVQELIAVTALLYPETAIVVGGPELATAAACEPFLHGGQVTAAVRGEGEVTMVEVVSRLRAGESLAGVTGCSWRNGTEVVHEPSRPPIRDLSQLASPFLTGWVPDDLFDRLAPNARGTFPRAFVETYRGCYMQCSYCQWGNGTKLRFEFPQDRVRAELSWLLSRNVRRVWIVDAMFGYKKEVAKELLRHIRDEKRRYDAQTSIVCYHNQDFYDTELFDLYREADVSVEVDLQSTDKEVLTRVGRAKWYIESFDRHLTAFAAQRVPTTGAADLIIGLPGDRMSSFSESVDFLLRQGMNVNLYQTSIIPDTPMIRSAAEDGIAYSSIAPRAVFKNATFPVHEMVAARLIGHGVDFFRRYPRTARLLWTQGFARPVDLCQRVGDLVWQRHGLMYGESHTNDAVLAGEQELVASLLDELCPHRELLPIVHDLFRLEAAAAKLAMPPLNAPPYPVLAGSATGLGLEDAESWLAAKPRFRHEAVEQVHLDYRIDKVIRGTRADDVLPEDLWRNVEREPVVALVYLSAPGVSSFRTVDEAVTHQLLLRFSGYFSVADCLDNLTRGWRNHDLAPLSEKLSNLAREGIVDPGLPVAAGAALGA